MRALFRPGVIGFAAAAVGAGAFLGYAGWPQPDRMFELTGLIFAAVLTSALAKPRPAVKDWATMPPSFVIEFISLLLLGPHVTMIVAASGTVTERLTESQSAHPTRRMLVNLAIAIAAAQAAGAAYLSLSRATDRFDVWPWHGLPIANAIIVYCLVKSFAVEIALPLVRRQPIVRAWPRNYLRGRPTYFIGASFAVGPLGIIDARAWEILPVAAVPLFFIYRAYVAYVERLDEQQRRHEVIDSLDQGMTVLDGNGTITLWNDALERILGCPRARAVGRTLNAAIPALSKTALQRAINEATKSQSPWTLTSLPLPSPAGPRTLDIRVLPVAEGVTLLWQDVTDRARAEHTLKRNEERLALAAEGANDGLWEWDLRTKELYVSGRWKAMIGLPATGGVGRLEDWMNRVHPEDLGGLKEALDAHAAGKSEHILHEHRIRHEDGAYRRVLCRGVAVR